MFRISDHFDGNTILCSNHSKEQGVGELLYYVSAIVRLTSIPFWVSGFTKGQGLIFYSIMTHVYAYYYQKTNYGFQKPV